MHICIVAGARPNFVKVAPIIRAIKKAQAEGNDIAFNLVYTGTESDPTLEDSLFDDLQISKPDVYLNVENDSLNVLTGLVMSAFEQYLQNHPTDAVIVVDDLASTMAAAIVTKKQGILLAHLVAGTRSFDINMPKEINRLVIDGLSDLLFTAGSSNNSAVSREGADSDRVYLVGNILMDTLRFNRQRFVKPAILNEQNIADGDYIVFTLNRKKLLNDPDHLKELLHEMLSHAGDTKIIAPLREQPAAIVQSLVEPNANFIVIPSLGYLEFGYLTMHAKGIITDSGNIAEEATFNGVPCITLNSYTEHAETVSQGTNVLAGENPELLGEYVSHMIDGQWKESRIPERWDGRAADRIVFTLLRMNEEKHDNR